MDWECNDTSLAYNYCSTYLRRSPSTLVQRTTVTCTYSNPTNDAEVTGDASVQSSAYEPTHASATQGCISASLHHGARCSTMCDPVLHLEFASEGACQRPKFSKGRLRRAFGQWGPSARSAISCATLAIICMYVCTLAARQSRAFDSGCGSRSSADFYIFPLVRRQVYL